MVEKKKNIHKKENIPDEYGEIGVHQHPHTQEQYEIPYHRFSDLPYNEYQREPPQEGMRYNEGFPKYEYDFQKIHYEYDNRNNFEREVSSEEEDKKIKRMGRKKITMEYIEGKNKRSVTFSKRKKGIMKKAYELNVLTGTQILLLVASESGHVYTFATPKLKPMISNHERLIQQCLNAPSSPSPQMRKNMNPYNNKYDKEDDKKDKYYPGYNDYYGNYDERS